MPSKTQLHHEKHLTLLFTLTVILVSFSFYLFLETFGYTQTTVTSGLILSLLAIFVIATPKFYYQTHTKYNTGKTDIKEVYKEIANFQDEYFQKRIELANSVITDAENDKIEAEKPFIKDRFHVTLKKENEVKNKGLKYEIDVDEEKVLEGRINLHKNSEGEVIINEVEESLHRMPLLGTIKSHAKTIRIFNKIAEEKDYEVEKIDFTPLWQPAPLPMD